MVGSNLCLRIGDFGISISSYHWDIDIDKREVVSYRYIEVTKDE